MNLENDLLKISNEFLFAKKSTQLDVAQNYILVLRLSSLIYVDQLKFLLSFLSARK